MLHRVLVAEGGDRGGKRIQERKMRDLSGLVSLRYVRDGHAGQRPLKTLFPCFLGCVVRDLSEPCAFAPVLGLSGEKG